MNDVNVMCAWYVSYKNKQLKESKKKSAQGESENTRLAGGK